MRTLLLAALLVMLFPAASVRSEPAPNSPERRVTLDLHDVPLRAALQQLFEGSGLNFAVEPGVPNVAITLSLRDVSVDGGLRRIVDSLAKQTPSVIAVREGGLYLIRTGGISPFATALAPGGTRPPAAAKRRAAASAPVAAPSPVAGRSSTAAPPSAQLAPGGLTILGASDDNSLVVRGTPERIAEFRRVLTLLDIPGKQLRVRISTGHLGAEGMVVTGGMMRLSDATRGGRFDVNAVPRINGDGSVDLALQGVVTTGGVPHPVQSHVRLTPERSEEIISLGEGARRVRLWARITIAPDIVENGTSNVRR